jgi:DNA-binding MarR family transcriptional regulator
VINEVSLAAGVLAAAFASGLLGLFRSSRALRVSIESEKNRPEITWVRDSGWLAQNLLVLETIAEDIESTPLDIAVRARLTPRELARVELDLVTAELIDRSPPDLVRLTDAGRKVLLGHRIEETSAHRVNGGLKPEPRSLDELDVAIGKAVAALEAQHAH